MAYIKNAKNRNTIAASLLFLGGLIHTFPSILTPVVNGISAGVTLQHVIGVLSVLIALDMFIAIKE